MKPSKIVWDNLRLVLRSEGAAEAFWGGWLGLCICEERVWPGRALALTHRLAGLGRAGGGWGLGKEWLYGKLHQGRAANGPGLPSGSGANRFESLWNPPVRPGALSASARSWAMIRPRPQRPQHPQHPSAPESKRGVMSADSQGGLHALVRTGRVGQWTCALSQVRRVPTSTIPPSAHGCRLHIGGRVCRVGPCPTFSGALGDRIGGGHRRRKIALSLRSRRDRARAEADPTPTLTRPQFSGFVSATHRNVGARGVRLIRLSGSQRCSVPGDKHPSPEPDEPDPLLLLEGFIN